MVSAGLPLKVVEGVSAIKTPQNNFLKNNHEKFRTKHIFSSFQHVAFYIYYFCSALMSIVVSGAVKMSYRNYNL